jgi:hypothetical protein
MASSDHLKPGEKGKIKAKVELDGRKGIISKGINVYSNDPKRPAVTLILKAAVRQ